MTLLSDNSFEENDPVVRAEKARLPLSIEQLAITNPILDEAAAAVTDILSGVNKDDPDKVREAWVTFSQITEDYVDTIEGGPEDPDVRARAQITTIIYKASIFYTVGNITRYLEELDAAEVYAANKGFDAVSQSMSEEIKTQIENLELSPEIIILKLKGIIHDADREYLRDQVYDDGIDINDLSDQVYGIIENDGSDADVIFATLGLTE